MKNIIFKKKKKKHAYQVIIHAIMSEHLAAPRITASNLDAFVNKHVSIVGKVTQLRGEQATIDADGNVTILLNRVHNILLRRSPSRSSFIIHSFSFSALLTI